MFQKILVLKLSEMFMVMKCTVFWDVTWFSLVEIYPRSNKSAAAIFRKDKDGANR
jgi:hypothetical protein